MATSMEIDHGGGVVTVYGHLSRFAARCTRARTCSRADDRLCRHDGLATGPHLHYEYHVNGRYSWTRRRSSCPSAGPIDPALRADFERISAPLLQRIGRQRTATGRRTLGALSIAQARQPPMSLYLGLMSGTSMDCIDAALLEVGTAGMRLRGRGWLREWPDALRGRLRRAAEDYEHVGLGGTRPARYHVRARNSPGAALRLLASAGVAPRPVRAIGSHGQTVLHQPRRAARLHAADRGSEHHCRARRHRRGRGFPPPGHCRRRPGRAVDAGVHAAAFAGVAETRAVVNIGGIANLTLLPAAGDVVGFDTGPGNCLLDACLGAPTPEPAL